MNDPQQRWDDQLRAALAEQAGSIQAVTPWTPPAEHRRTGRHPWRWLAPLAAAAAVLLIVVGAAGLRIAAERDARPASPAPPTRPVPSATVAPTTRTVEPTPSSRASATTATRTPTPSVPTTSVPTPIGSGPTTITPTRASVTSTPSGTATHATAPGRATTPSATITPCMRQYTYESMSAEWSGVYGTQFSGLSELPSCGGPDDVNWTPTGHWFALHLDAQTRIFVLRPGGQGDRALPFATFAAYLSHPFTGLFVITGPKTDPTTLTEIYHP